MIGIMRGTTRIREEVQGLPAPVASFTPKSSKCLDLQVAVTATQSGSGDPSPDNVRPIIGWDSVELSVNEVITIINLGGTYYGGVLDVTNGVMTITHGKYVVTGNEGFSATGNGQHILFNNVGSLYNTLKRESSNDIVANMKCSFAKAKSYNALNVSGTTDGIGVGTLYLIVGSEQYDNWSNLVGEEIIYELKEEFQFTIQLTPTQVQLLANQVNTIFADSGDVNSLVYGGLVNTVLVGRG